MGIWVGSKTRSVVIVLGQDNDRPVGSQAGPCVFEDLGGRVGLVKNIQGPAWLPLLAEFCALFCFTPLFATEPSGVLTLLRAFAIR